ncbi:MAG: polyprenyl synthetase family protein, partial [Candidatus Bathyarchaeia archaeon]
EKIGCKEVYEGIEYYTSTWNDTTRPGLLALACESVGGNLKKAIPLQTAMLLIDAAMDIHDDIIDKSKTKGSKETLYGKFGEEITLLIGNTFLVKGFHHLHKATEKMPATMKKAIISSVKNFLIEVIEAHIKESILKKDKWNVNPLTYLKILEQKAADIEGHMKIGAIIGGGTTNEIKAISKYGRYIGTILMVRSEIIDVYETDELKNRIEHECLPLPILYALRSKKKYKMEIQRILGQKINDDDINTILDIVCNSSTYIPLKKRLERFQKSAMLLLTSVKKRKWLKFLAEAVMEDL